MKVVEVLVVVVVVVLAVLVEEDEWSLRRETFLPQESSPNIAAGFSSDLANTLLLPRDSDTVDDLDP